MISNELLSIILKTETFLPIWQNNYNEIVYSTKSYKETGNSINIYELTHKCKKWIANKEHSCNSGISNKNHKAFCNLNGNTYFGETEPEAVFKATQYILELEEKQHEKTI